MLRNYFKIAWRNLLKNKAYSAINILGLGIGMAVALLIGLWVWDELSFDSYHKNHSSLAKVMLNQNNNGSIETGEQIAIPLKAELQNKFGSEFKSMSLATGNYPTILAVNAKKISIEGVWAEATFPSMFSIKMIQGNQNALDDPSSILLSASVAKTLFGTSDPINKILKVNNTFNFKVAGIYEDLPKNTTLHSTRFLLPWKSFITQDWVSGSLSRWGHHSYWLYVQLNTQGAFSNVNAKIKDITNPYFDKGHREETFLHPMDKWHLYSDFKNGMIAGGRISLVTLFGIIGVFVLLLACINFMNLSTARSEKRAKEVGVRKAIGSKRTQLISQFLCESFIVTACALLISLLIVQVTLPWFNNFTEKQVALPWANLWFDASLVLFALLVSLAAGSYPAFYLSGFNAIKVLKGNVQVGRFASLPRKVLVVIQFTVSITLIIGTLIVYRQIQHAKSRPVGYTREGLVSVSINTNELKENYNALQNDLLQTRAIESMAQSSSPATDIHSNTGDFKWRGKDPNASVSLGIITVSQEYGETIKWKVKDGKDFSKVLSTDKDAIILNESAVKLMGLKNPVGEIIEWWGKKSPVVGVVKDMVMESPYKPLKPTVFSLNSEWSSFIIIRVKGTESMSPALAKIELIFKQYNPGGTFEYKFVDEEYNRKFSDEVRVGNLATLFAILAIFISCLGLFGLASFVAEQRNKEISIRKVLGATVFNIWRLLSKDFILMVLLSCFLSIPIAWHFLSNWLEGFEYRTEISWWIFAISGLGAVLITLFTVSFQAISAALANPVKSLRTE